jgi:hypothetical protein
VANVANGAWPACHDSVLTSLCTPPPHTHPTPPPTSCCPPQIKEEISKYKVGAPARVGLLAPNDVFIPAGGTGMDPSQTSFFQVRAMW